MYKVSDEVIYFIDKTMETWRVGIDSRREKLS